MKYFFCISEIIFLVFATSLFIQGKFVDGMLVINLCLFAQIKRDIYSIKAQREPRLNSRSSDANQTTFVP